MSWSLFSIMKYVKNTALVYILEGHREVVLKSCEGIWKDKLYGLELEHVNCSDQSSYNVYPKNFNSFL